MKDSFFIIDSDFNKTLHSRLYGYIIGEAGQYIDEISDFNPENLKHYAGHFIAVINTGNTIKIFQDLNGSFGIFYYYTNDYFAISNSALLLFNYIKKIKKVNLNINRQYLSYFILNKYIPLSIAGTMNNQIHKLRPYETIIIDKHRSLRIEKMTLPLISVESRAGLDLIDKWANKYINAIGSFSCPIKYTDVTGGKDSRICMALALHGDSCTPANQRQMRYFSVKGYAISEDYVIASRLANQFDFKLCDYPRENVSPYDSSDAWQTSMLLQAGCHGFPYFIKEYHEDPILHITGRGGETIRNYHFYHPIETLRTLYKNDISDKALAIEASLFFNKQLLILKKLMPEELFSHENAVHELAIEALNCYHFGHAEILSWLANEICISPLLDPTLKRLNWRINKNMTPDIISAVISLRINDHLLDIDFAGADNFPDNIIECAKMINKTSRFEYKKDIKEYKIKPLILKRSLSKYNYINKLREEFSDDKCYKTIEKLVGKAIIDDALFDMQNKSHHPEMKMFKLLSIKYFSEGCSFMDTSFFNNFVNK